MSDILDKVRKLNWLLQESHSGALSFEEICEILSNLLEANVYALDDAGRVLGVAFKIKEDSSLVSDDETGDWIMPEEYNQEMLKITETKANLHDA
ncbi:MAG: GTP-sensing pleiotropic transcriptional regulator CodY, partial [Bacillota bacterium]